MQIVNGTEILVGKACLRAESNYPHQWTREISSMNSDHTRRRKEGNVGSNQFSLVEKEVLNRCFWAIDTSPESHISGLDF